MRQAATVKLVHMLNTSVPNLAHNLLKIKSTTALLWLVDEVCFSLQESLGAFAVDPSVSDLWDSKCEYVFPSLVVCLAVGCKQPEEDGLFSL